jgi:hypothetical protein
MTIINSLLNTTATGLVALMLSTPSCPATTQQQYTQTQYQSDLAHIQDQLDETQTKEKYTKSELFYTQEEFNQQRTNPAFLKKAELIHKNPKQAFNYLSKEQQKQFTRFCTSLQTSKEKSPFDDIIKNDHKNTYPFINTKKPKIADALIMYLHETHLNQQEN